MSLFLLSLHNAYQDLLRKDAEVAAARHAITLTIDSANNDPEQQEQHIREVIRQPVDKRPNAILVAAVNEAQLASAAKEAAELGVGWVLLNRNGRYLQQLRSAHPAVPLFSVYADQYDIGHIQGKQFKQLLAAGGDLFYVHGPVSSSSAEQRLAGMREELANTGINVVNSSSDWTNLGVQRAIEYWKQSIGTRPSRGYLVGAQNDDMAAGALKVLRHQTQVSPLSGARLSGNVRYS